MTAITVGTNDLRAGLVSVAPHAGPDDDHPALHRIRLTADRHNVWVTATNRYSAALAIVSTEDTDTDDQPPIDLSPVDVQEILALFKATKDGDEDGATLRIEADDRHTTITDVSGLFPGKALTLPRYKTDDNFPDLPKLIHGQLTADSNGTDHVVTDAKLLGLFGHAARAYKQPLEIETGVGQSGTLVIACGESFLGLLQPQKPTEDGAARLTEWRDAWRNRLDIRTGALAGRIPAQV